MARKTSVAASLSVARAQSSSDVEYPNETPSSSVERPRIVAGVFPLSNAPRKPFLRSLQNAGSLLLARVLHGLVQWGPGLWLLTHHLIDLPTVPFPTLTYLKRPLDAL
ncbi:hypothetical protein BD311DRAFT_769634 [Dichomitus squalens]|uniref:Uncharacterized protein n=1 Tax=Dichomitus squalens TaxID=114155 RepID=A0A4Q9M8U2_9APHY|nr:hypothetical protein BD311DRAFT_769634 [Dichomitus squalens]